MERVERLRECRVEEMERDWEGNIRSDSVRVRAIFTLSEGLYSNMKE